MSKLEMKISFLAIVLLVISFSPAISGSTQPTDFQWWCGQTPHQQDCESSFTDSSNNGNAVIGGKSDFLRMMMDHAVARSLQSKNNVLSLGPKCRNAREKAAWQDCVELYEYIVSHLNKACYPTAQSTAEDVQTWLSAAMTYQETCQQGFQDLGVTDYVMPMTNDVVLSNLISNALAINKGFCNASSYNSGFPSWVSAGHRKLLMSTASPASIADIVVAQDGSGHFTTISEALAAISEARKSKKRPKKKSARPPPPSPSKTAPPPPTPSKTAPPPPPLSKTAPPPPPLSKTAPPPLAATPPDPVPGGATVMYLKAGVYSENLVISNDNIFLLGDGIGQTIITASKSVGGGSTTFASATVGITGNGFMAKGVSIRNTAGAQNQQAVALRVGSDLSVFYQVSIEGYQDTLYALSLRQFYKDCDIYGTVDYIFGNAAAVIQSCNLYSHNTPTHTNTLTAQSKSDPNQNTGFSIQGCTVAAASDLIPVQSSVNTYLGRPWKQYSTVVFMESNLGSLINSAGWYPWLGPGTPFPSTILYGEYQNTGPGSNTANRVISTGIYPALTTAQASQFTVTDLISGNNWLPAKNVPYTPGL